MPPRDHDAGYLWDMLTAAEGIREVVAGVSLDAYTANENLRLAVERRFEIIGEAARRVSDEFKDAHPEIPWRPIIAQRNVLAHDYAGVDDRLLWSVARERIPELVGLLRPLIPPIPPDGEK